MLYKNNNKKNKLNAEKVTYNGIKFDSKKEAARYAELSLMLKAGVISDLKLQVKYELTGKNDRFKPSHYIADFVYTDDRGKTVVEDVKGCKSGAVYQLFKLKQKIMYDKYGILVIET